MPRKPNRIAEIERQQLDRKLEQARQSMPALRPPRQGWVAALRTALGMTKRALAARMAMSPQAVAQLEDREVNGSATLKAMQDAARALGGEFVYAIVPEKPIGVTLEERAYRLARRMTTSVHHTMRLEDQETDADIDRRTWELARELLSSPRRLWSVPNG